MQEKKGMLKLAIYTRGIPNNYLYNEYGSLFGYAIANEDFDTSNHFYFTDFSGSYAQNRPGLNELLNSLSKFDVLIIKSYESLHIDYQEYKLLKQKINKENVEIITLEPIIEVNGEPI